MGNETLTYAVPFFGLIALAFAFVKANWVNKQDPGTERMQEICGYVRELSLIHISEPTRLGMLSRMPSSA